MSIPPLSHLRYVLVEGHPPLAPLQILQQVTLSWRDWTVSLYILGASHAVRFTRGDRRFTELLACLPSGYADEPGMAAPLAQRDLPGDLLPATQSLMTSPCPGMRYTVRIECGPLDHDRLTDEYAGDVLMHSFPLLPSEKALVPRDGESLLLPVTRIGWRMRERAISIETIHTYPEEGHCVRTWSMFEEVAS